MPICIKPELIDKVKKIITEPSSISRDKQLRELFGNEASAKEINKAYENALLLKNQETAIDKFISNFTEIGQKEKADLKLRIKERLAQRKEKILDKDLLAISQDIWNKKYKIDIALEDVEKINNIKKQLVGLEEKMQNTLALSPQRMEYGAKLVELSNVIDNLKNPRNTMGFGSTVKNILKTTGQRFSKEQGITGNIVEGVRVATDILTSAVYKSVQASMDISYALRQGFKVLTKNPKVWSENMVEAFKPFAKITSQKDQQIVMDAFKASLVSHPMYEQAIKGKLAIGVIEDFFPTTLAEKIPAIGNIFKASNDAFTVFSQGARMSLFEDMVSRATKQGVELTPQLYKDIAKVANSITGRGSLGKYEAASSSINKLAFSGRYIKSAIDTFTMPFDMKLSDFARKEAMKSSASMLSTIGGLMATTSLFTDVEWNPQSSKFGKAKVPGSKDTWVDLTAGIGSYITLASRIATGKSKSATTGKVSDLYNPKYGGRTAYDVLLDFGTNKLAPMPSIGAKFLRGKTFEGKKPTIPGAAGNLATPIVAGNVYDAFTEEDAATALISSTFDLLGMSQTNYTKFK